MRVINNNIIMDKSTVAGITMLFVFCAVSTYWIANLACHSTSVKHVYPIVCNSKGEFCRDECRDTLQDLNDTWGSNTNNADAISRSILECIDKCIAE